MCIYTGQPLLMATGLNTGDGKFAHLVDRAPPGPEDEGRTDYKVRLVRLFAAFSGLNL